MRTVASHQMLPSLLPIFPLPNVVLFPNVFLPLHIFEPRYRQMVSDAVAGDRMIGMVLLQPGYEDEYEHEHAPAVYEVGCAGLITYAERRADGCYNIVLRGLERFRIIGEEGPSSSVLYRRALIAPLAEADARRHELKLARQKLEAILAPLLNGTPAEHGLPATMPDEELVNALAQYLQLEPIEKQALLERDSTLTRCEALMELLEMKALIDRGLGGEGQVH
jgi:uncharacterized protein